MRSASRSRLWPGGTRMGTGPGPGGATGQSQFPGGLPGISGSNQVNGYPAGAILLGDGLTAPRLLQVFDRGEVLPESRAELLFPLAGESKALDVTALPDTAQICNCNGVSKGKIISAVKAGHRSLQSVCDATRAGTGCGSCKHHVQALLEFASEGLIVNDPP